MARLVLLQLLTKTLIGYLSIKMLTRLNANHTSMKNLSFMHNDNVYYRFQDIFERDDWFEITNR